MIATGENFPMSRYMHCHNVGLKMYQYAKDNFGWDEVKCHDMFLLGTFHDIGYELNADAFEHDTAMCDALGHNGYKYAKEIKYHSFMQDEYDTPEMRLLYFGDMTVDGMGNWCTLDERLKDLEDRHGKDSEVYIESKKIADQIIEWGFDDRLSKDMYVAKLSDRPNTVAVKKPSKGLEKLKQMSSVGKPEETKTGRWDDVTFYQG